MPGVIGWAPAQGMECEGVSAAKVDLRGGAGELARDLRLWCEDTGEPLYLWASSQL